MRHLRFRFLALGVVLMLAVPLVAACGSTTGGGGTTTGKTIKVGLVTDTGGLNDKSFNHLAYTGLLKAEHDLGVRGDVLQSVTQTDYVPNLTHFAAQGYDLVIAVGFDMQVALGQVSQTFPNTHFAIIDGSPTDANFNPVPRANVLSLFFREQEAGALVGTVAGVLEKDQKTPKPTGVISAVGGQKIPPVDRYIAGYQWAAKMADPSIKVLVGYSNDFTDPTKCSGIANSQFGQGSDVVFQVAGGCGNGALQAAGQKGVYSIGVDADQGFVDKSVIVSALKKVDVATFDAIKFIQDGSLPPDYQATGEAPCVASTRSCTEFLFNLKNGGVGYAVDNLNPLPSDVQTAVTNLENAIKAGQQTPPETVS
jgi:basic membrane protein A